MEDGSQHNWGRHWRVLAHGAPSAKSGAQIPEVKFQGSSEGPQ
jgi:hypothetical protein